MKSHQNSNHRESIFLIISLILLFLAGCLSCFPYFHTQWQSRQNQRIVDNTTAKAANSFNTATLKRRVSNYNQLIRKQQQADQLINQTAINQRIRLMKKIQPDLRQPLGFVSVPAIKMENMPFYYGDDDWALAHGAGLLPWTSLPFDDPSTLAEISGHTGMSQVFFDNIRYLKKGDLFYVTIFNQKFSYQVTHREVVDPNRASSVRTSYAVKGKRQVALMTCTPRYINNRRLIVYGSQVSLHQAKKEPTISRVQWTPEKIMALLSLLPFIAIIIILILWQREQRQQRRQQDETI